MRYPCADTDDIFIIIIQHINVIIAANDRLIVICNIILSLNERVDVGVKKVSIASFSSSFLAARGRQ